jgi:hypothetical protein
MGALDKGKWWDRFATPAPAKTATVKTSRKAARAANK